MRQKRIIKKGDTEGSEERLARPRQIKAGRNEEEKILF